MGVVTVSAAYGAAGAEVAPAVAERLGLPFHDRAIAAQVAGRLGVPVAEAEANDETVVRGLWRLVASLGTMPDPVGGVLPTSALPDARAYRAADRAGAGRDRRRRRGSGARPGRARWCSATGRTPCTCGWTARAERRLEAAVARSGRSRDEVRREMEANDRTREAYVRHFYRCDPASAQHYHLVIDSTALPVETVVDLVVTAARARGIGAALTHGRPGIAAPD